MTLYSGLEHIHKRKRKKRKNLKDFPNKDPKIKFLDDIMLVIASVGPLFLLPQIIKIYKLKDATGISVLTFSLLAITHMAWIFYGFIHKDRQITISHILFFLANTSLIIGGIIF